MRTLRRFLQVVAVASVLTTAGSAWAQATRTWNGGGGNGNWSVGANWGGTAPSSSGDNLVFAGTTQLSTVNNFGDAFRVNNITFSANAGAFTLGGQSINLYSNISVASGGSAVTHTIDLSMAIQSSRTITTTDQGRIVVNGIISDSGGPNYGITKYGVGTLTLNGLNTFDGQMVIGQGTVSANTLANVGAASSVGAGTGGYSIIQLGQAGIAGTLQYTGSGHSTDRQIMIGANGSSIRADGTGAVNFTAATFNSTSSASTPTFTLGGGSTADNTIAGAIVNSPGLTGTLAIAKQDAGKWILSGNNTYTGGTTVGGGTLLATQAAALPSYGTSGKVTVNSGSTLAVRAGGAGEWDSGQIGGLLGTTAFQSGSSLGIDVTGTNSFSYAGNIGVTQANKGFVKSGLGKLTLTGDNTYTGATNVNEGTLIVNGNNSLATGVVTVAAGATLGGNGTIGGATTVYGTLSPGVSPGVLKFASPVTLDSASTTLMEIVGATDSPGVSQDQIVVLSNQLTYGGTLALDMGTTLGVGAYTWDLFDFGSETGTWNAIKLQNQYSGSLADADANGVWDLTSGLNTWQFTESNGVLNLTVVPEPSTLALLAIAGVVGGGVQLRRYFRRGRHEKRSA